MKKVLIFILVVLIQSINAQAPGGQSGDAPFRRTVPFFSEIHIIPCDSLNNYYFVYKLPYNQLFFIKNDEQYLASLKLTVEVYDTSNNFVERQIKVDNISVNDFSKTNEPFLFVEGLIQFKLPKSDYRFLPVLTDVHSNQEVRPHPLTTKKINPKSSDFLSPLVIDENAVELEGKTYQMLANLSGSIPFGKSQFELMIPSVDTSLQQIYLTAVNNKDTIYNGYLSEYYNSSLDIQNIDNRIVINTKGNSHFFKNFIFKEFVDKLDEGVLSIVVSRDKDSKNPEKFVKEVIWFDKPFSLRNSEFAIKSLKYIAAQPVISKMLDSDQLNYPKELVDFWKKYDPTPGTKYNELMDEYYKRVDYSLRNFASIENKNGIDSDRGKIFIKFGEPDNIERGSDNFGRVIEKWIYEKNNLSFIFIDKNGTGEFALLKG